MGLILNGRFISGLVVGMLALWAWQRYRARMS